MNIKTKIKQQIPNAITSCNLLAGTIATIMAYQAQYNYALCFVLLAALFDFCDGLVARLLKVSGELGKQLDSLADVISFGLLPGMLAYSLMHPLATYCIAIPYLGFLITTFAALRLAKFNIDTRQTTSFLGLATPANALFWCGIAYTFGQDMDTTKALIVLALTLASCYLQICELPMFSLKIHTLKWTASYKQWTLIIGTIILLALFQLNALTLIIIWYIALSLFFWIYEKTTKRNP